MAHQSDLIASDILAYLKSQEEKSLLRFITCGSVDDGKSTLIGRLLWDSKMVFEDQLAALAADSRRVGTQGENIDYALLLDGLQAEREQGITIDVAYRFFSTDKRKFIVADTPGHEQYTRNMVTGASTAQVAVILIDARKGVLTQTRRHSYLVSLVGIRHIVLAINKMDLVDYSAERFATIRQEYENFAAGLGFDQIAAIPISALQGDNVLLRSANTPWHQGPTLMEYLETVQVADAAARKPFRLRVQWVNRPNLDFRGFSGTIASGVVRPGDEVVVTSSGKTSRVQRIVTLDGDLPQAVAGQAVTLTLTDEIDISRGDMIAHALERPYHADRLEAKVVWLHEEALKPGRSYLLKAGAATTPARIGEVKFKVNVNTLQQEPGQTLQLNEVGVCGFTLSQPISFDSYRENRGTGNFILIDRMTNATVGAGMIHQPLLRSGSGRWPELELDRKARAQLKAQPPRALWFTGPSAADNLELARLVERKLHSLGRHGYLLDDQELRRGLNRDLEPGAASDGEHLRRAAEVAKLLLDAGLIVLTAVTAPSCGERRLVRELFSPEDFLEVFVSSHGEDRGGAPGGSRFEAPETPEITLNGTRGSAIDRAEQLVKDLFD
jgi:bifunctional enzyme CysN/CysC